MRDKKIAGGPMTFIRKKDFAFPVRHRLACACFAWLFAS